MKMIFAKEMEPTTNEYYLARLIDIVSVICHENAEMIKVMKKSFACNDVTGIIRNPQVHPYVRSKYAKLGSVLFMDPVRFRPQAEWPLPPIPLQSLHANANSNAIALQAMSKLTPAPRVRVPATVRAELNSENEQEFTMLSEEHIDLRDTIFAYMKQVPLVMDPRDGNINRLTRQVFELVLLFLRCGDFGEKKSDATIGTKVYLDKEKHRLETGVPSPEFIATVVNQLSVGDDVGFRKLLQDAPPDPDPCQYNEDNKYFAGTFSAR